MGEGGYKQINKTLNVCAFDDYLSSQQACLPVLADVEQLTPRVLRVLGQNAGKFTLQGTNTYIVGTGREQLIIDTSQGYREWADLIQGTLKAEGVTFSHVILTHWHGDHTGGVPDLLRMYPHLDDSIYKNDPGAAQQPIEDGQVFRVEGATLHAVHTPGHSHDHMSFVLEEEQAIFTGDNVLGHGTSAVEDLGLYMKTLRKLETYHCDIGYPAHGAVIKHLPSKLAWVLAQKYRRERQCLLALKKVRKQGHGVKGSATVKELCTLIYGNDIEQEVREMALEPFIEEVLRKLTEDDKVAFQLRNGQRKWFSVSE
ncbi:hypothetical protein LTR66_006821 [Elasticomyces elasticus]|nr:hypothetical protein LTR66_006821 [Elasticomyces elasticus]KAK5011435.1 Atrochrysone carboxyl ACP thioesterase AgnL7 [Elasticomyces elasticus]